MLLRLLLALLLAAFALPGGAPAACHDAPVAGHAMPMPTDAPDHHALPVHGCIGCIPPADWQSPRLDAPAAVSRAPLLATVTQGLTGAVPPPDLPPPRRG